MKERPILFSGPMVRAILSGQKTQTRRVMREQICEPGVVRMACPGYCEVVNEHGVSIPGFRCPYGKPGDRLWVREAHHRTTDGRSILIGYEVPGENREYEAPGVGRVREFRHHLGGWGGRVSRNFPSIHMPRWASRITLEITGVRVERLQDISEADAFAEGIQRLENHSWNAGPARPLGTYRGLDEWSEDEGFWTDAVSAYAALWDSINGPGAWDANPWVWVVEFKRIKP